MSSWRKGFTLGLVREEKSPVEENAEVEFDPDHSVQPGDLTLEQDTAGGLGRHLGLFSTTFLMYILRSSIHNGEGN